MIDTPTSTAAPSTSPFLALPTEIRLQCYIYLFLQHKRELKSPKFAKYTDRFERQTLMRYPGILMVSKQIHTEASPLYDRLAVVSVSPHWRRDVWLEHVPKSVLDTAQALEVTHREAFTDEVRWDLWLSSAAQRMPALQRMIVQIPRRLIKTHVLLEDKHALHVLQADGLLCISYKAQINALMQACINCGRSMEVWLDCRVKSNLEEIDMRVELNLRELASSRVLRKEYLKKYSREDSDLQARSTPRRDCVKDWHGGCHPDQGITMEALEVRECNEDMTRAFTLEPEDARLICEQNQLEWAYNSEISESEDEAECLYRALLSLYSLARERVSELPRDSL